MLISPLSLRRYLENQCNHYRGLMLLPLISPERAMSSSRRLTNSLPMAAGLLLPILVSEIYVLRSIEVNLGMETQKTNTRKMFSK
ncbi:hypothetical protein LXL04_033578 [Taraxacum kok-saghyz]